MDQNQQSGGGQGRRGHYRGRRGSERRGNERRQPPDAPPSSRGSGHVDVDQIMRDIRARISQRHGVDLTSAQIQELAAHRLEAILDPRTVNPTLLDQLRKAAGTPVSIPAVPPPSASDTIDESSLFDSFIRRLLRPILKLFFNPEPLVQALHRQSAINAEAAGREVERERRQAEWNALHYELLQRLVRESARNTIELKDITLRIEALSAKLDFNERRVRSIEGATTPSPARHVSRPVDSAQPQEGPTTDAAGNETTASTLEGQQRRRRRRRRGRRGGTGADVAVGSPEAALQEEATGELEDAGDELEVSTEAGALEGTPEPTHREGGVPEGTVHGGAVHAAEPASERPVQPDPALTPDAAPTPSSDEPVDR